MAENDRDCDGIVFALQEAERDRDCAERRAEKAEAEVERLRELIRRVTTVRPVDATEAAELYGALVAAVAGLVEG